MDPFEDAHLVIFMRNSYVRCLKTSGIINKQVFKRLRGPTDQKWSNFAIFGFIVLQFDPWVGAHLWKKNRVLGALETTQMGEGERSPPPHCSKFESLPILLKLYYHM